MASRPRRSWGRELERLGFAGPQSEVPAPDPEHARRAIHCADRARPVGRQTVPDLKYRVDIGGKIGTPGINERSLVANHLMGPEPSLSNLESHVWARVNATLGERAQS